jgi:HK97 gp10 family phage protein
MTFTVEVDGDEVFSSLKDLDGNITDIIHAALVRGGLIIEGDAKSNCPVDTGNLRGSIHTVDDETVENGVIVGTHTEYAPYVEFGTGIYAENGTGREEPWAWHGTGKKWGGWHKTRGQRAQPFLRPAFENQKEEAINEIKRHIAEELENYTQ